MNEPKSNPILQIDYTALEGTEIISGDDTAFDLKKLYLEYLESNSMPYPFKVVQDD